MAETKRVISPGAEEILKTPYMVLDKGQIMLLDYMGNDSEIVAAARTSTTIDYAREIKDETRLIRRLMREGHASPFEQVEIKLFCKMPLYIARQWIRYRTANVNEISGRYTEMVFGCHVPDLSELKKQDQRNKQMSGQPLDSKTAQEVLHIIVDQESSAQEAYQRLLQLGLSREMSRIVQPSAVYTQWVWKNDLHNVFHFLQQRLAEDAQPQIKAYAKILANIAEKVAPIAYQAFVDYALKAIKLSKMEVKLLVPIQKTPADLEKLCTEEGLVESEIRAFRQKLKTLGILEK